MDHYTKSRVFMKFIFTSKVIKSYNSYNHELLDNMYNANINQKIIKTKVIHKVPKVLADYDLSITQI